MIPVVILCGGRGTRMGDTLNKKELIDIGGRPLLWHVMQIFSSQGHQRFVLALGHLGEQVRRYFLEYETMSRDVTLQLATAENSTQRQLLSLGKQPNHAPWTVTMVDTGLQTERASRLNRLRDYLAGCERFFFAYGEAVADIDLGELLAFHKAHGRLATITGIQVDFQYGVIEADEQNRVGAFVEKPPLPHWINGGFMLFEAAVLDLIDPTREDVHEKEILAMLAAQDELRLYKHRGYWQSMKTLNDAYKLQRDWAERRPWKMKIEGGDRDRGSSGESESLVMNDE